MLNKIYHIILSLQAKLLKPRKSGVKRCYCLIRQNIEKVYLITVFGIVIWLIGCFVRKLLFLLPPSHVCATRKCHLLQFYFQFFCHLWFVFCKTLALSSKFAFCVCKILLAKFVYIKRLYHTTSITDKKFELMLTRCTKVYSLSLIHIWRCRRRG